MSKSRLLATKTSYLAEELGKLFFPGIRCADGESSLFQCLSEEVADFFARGSKMGRFCFLACGAFICAGKKIGEQFQGHW